MKEKTSRHSPFNYNKIGRKEKTQIKLIRISLLGSVNGPGKKRTKKRDVHEDEHYGKKRTAKISGSNIQMHTARKQNSRGYGDTNKLSQPRLHKSAQRIRDKTNKILFITIYDSLYFSDEFLAV